MSLMATSVNCAGCRIAMLLRWPIKRDYWTPALAKQNSQESKQLAKLKQLQALFSMIIMLPQQDKCMIYDLYVTVFQGSYSQL